jgi:hypothetical protein
LTEELFKVLNPYRLAGSSPAILLEDSFRATLSTPVEDGQCLSFRPVYGSMASFV